MASSLTKSAAPAAAPRSELPIVVKQGPSSPAYVAFQPIDQGAGATSTATNPLVWAGVAFVAYQLLKKK